MMYCGGTPYSPWMASSRARFCAIFCWPLAMRSADTEEPTYLA